MAFIIECKKGRGRIVGSFADRTATANAYRGELLGLMAVHLLLLSVNKVNSDLRGEAHIISDCLGTLRKVKDLPPYRIPSDILKNILVHCLGLTFHTRVIRLIFIDSPAPGSLN